ncbi:MULTISPECIES: MOSC domain-containing protein [unclassified Sphingomonas]|uniref:MOSC domain-containing protein n=1 Tax=unclassified Sphingomonas TaxID=196159 RepID=UPI0027811482|nr:MOSC domain-containing protein [Sphingomonas sp. SORGH_AS_0879]MDQ1230363.1 MOSC domain-containing protein YiiM [Sphingomonas sp. SORGH_AS_0879]
MSDGRVMTGHLAGIARHAVPKGRVEVLDTAIVTLAGGVEGDCRGRIKPGGRGRRQVTLIERADWDAALAEIDRDIPWQERRANLLVEDFDLPQIPGTRLRIGPVLLEITMECDPCHRMDAIADGLQAALRPDWRGGVCTRVIEGGTIRIGDNIRIEES